MNRTFPRFRALPLFLVLIPIFFCALLYTLNPNLYIPVLNLSIPHSVLSYGTLVWCFVWINFTPIRIACRKHIISEIAFYVFPITIPALLIFAQWHFAIALLLLAVIIVAFVLIVIRLSPRKTSPAYFNILTRCLVGTCAAVLLVPSIITMFCYDLRGPTYSVSQELFLSLAADQAENASSQENEDLFFSSKELLLEFHPAHWSEHTLEEKLVLVQALTDFECRRFGIPEVPVIAEPLDPGMLGRYSHSANMISVNAAFLDCADPVDIISTVAHESHHAYTAWLCANTDFEDPVAGTLLYAQVRAWKENASHYIPSALDYEGYTQQPLESDAAHWADEEAARIQACWQESIPPESDVP